MILIDFPIRTLSRALSVSKHCRGVIASNHQLRQTLFLEGTRIPEYLAMVGRKFETVTIVGFPLQLEHRLLTITQEPRQASEDDRLIVKAHQALHALPESRFNS